MSTYLSSISGRTPDAQAPADTYNRAILDRLLIDLSWASSHLEGSTYRAWTRATSSAKAMPVTARRQPRRR